MVFANVLQGFIELMDSVKLVRLIHIIIGRIRAAYHTVQIQIKFTAQEFVFAEMDYIR